MSKKGCPVTQAHNRRYGIEYREWVANATPEQKALWERLKKIDTNPEHRAECRKIYEQLQVFLPPSDDNYGGKYGKPSRPVCNDNEEKGFKSFLRRRF